MLLIQKRNKRLETHIVFVNNKNTTREASKGEEGCLSSSFPQRYVWMFLPAVYLPVSFHFGCLCVVFFLSNTLPLPCCYVDTRASGVPERAVPWPLCALQGALDQGHRPVQAPGQGGQEVKGLSLRGHGTSVRGYKVSTMAICECLCVCVLCVVWVMLTRR